MRVQAAVIIEPRNHAALPLVVFQTATILGPDWPIYIYHGLDNQELCESIQHVETAGQVHLRSLGVRNLSIPEYSALLYNPRFWEEIPTASHILVFQTDSLLLKNSPHKIQDFLAWDYVGAPWRHLPGEVGGNGGLSLRRKSAMLALLRRETLIPAGNIPEDLWFCRKLRRNRFRVAPPKIAQTFSVESIFYKQPFGIHKAYARLSQSNWHKLVTFEPFLRDLFKLQQKKATEMEDQQACKTCETKTKGAFSQRGFQFCTLECLRKFQKDVLPAILEAERAQNRTQVRQPGDCSTGGGDCC